MCRKQNIRAISYNPRTNWRSLSNGQPGFKLFPGHPLNVSDRVWASGRETEQIASRDRFIQGCSTQESNNASTSDQVQKSITPSHPPQKLSDKIIIHRQKHPPPQCSTLYLYPSVHNGSTHNTASVKQHGKSVLCWSWSMTGRCLEYVHQRSKRE